MQRRLDVALGLMHRPQVLFLDEPTTGLDPEARTAMWDEIDRLAGEEGLTILLTTHYLEEADRLADSSRSSTAAGSSSRAPPTSSRANCAATPSTWSSRAAGRRRPAGARRASAACARWRSTAARSRARADDGGGRDPAVLAALDAPACASPP